MNGLAVLPHFQLQCFRNPDNWAGVCGEVGGGITIGSVL